MSLVVLQIFSPEFFEALFRAASTPSLTNPTLFLEADSPPNALKFPFLPAKPYFILLSQKDGCTAIQEAGMSILPAC
jgi:hypothetical protein